jgi:hypothetical protein
LPGPVPRVGALKVPQFNVSGEEEMAINPLAWLLGAALALASSTTLGALQLLASSAVMHAAIPAGQAAEMRLVAGPCLAGDNPGVATLWDGGDAIQP